MTKLIISCNNSSSINASVIIKIQKVDIKPLYYFYCVFFAGCLLFVSANCHLFAWILAFPVLMYFTTCILMDCCFFSSLSVWEIILSLVASSWFLKSTLLRQVIGHGNCIKLLDNSIKGAWFMTAIVGNVFNYVYCMVWCKIAICIISCWMDCINKVRWAIFTAVDRLRVIKMNCILNIDFGNNDALDVDSCQLLLG